MTIYGFEVNDYLAYVSNYAGNPQELAKEIKANPEYFEDDINGAASRKCQIEDSAAYLPKSSGIDGSALLKMKPIDGSGIAMLMSNLR
jgi:hypothetical protein